ncbi:MAG: hypothetical protein RIC19_12950 [Phaeodactylibacter sp.]|uniref:hypothetical protein n=1 Tax=Phaeodactylibacter sp. TaxID=1940289 RepID=UPI0032EB0E08
MLPRAEQQKAPVKAFKIIGILPAGLVVLYLLGSKPAPPQLQAQLPVLATAIAALGDSIANAEQAIPQPKAQ